MEIIGRGDDQLSVRGFRIEANEILNIMKTFKSISEICLDVDNDNLIAYYTTNDNLDINEVKNALKEELPPYMIPSLFIELDEIPLNPNGKIDKSALKKTSRDNADVEISDEVLKCVVESFKQVLNLDAVLVNDDFVALGGNSLSSMNLQRLLKDKLNVNVYANEILELSTPFNIANHIKFDLKDFSSFEINYDFNDSCPLSQSQLNVYLDESINKADTAYNIPFKIKLNQYSADEIERALTKLFEIYPILKARIITNEGNLPQCVFNGQSEINRGSSDDIESFVRPFELDKCLSRFLIIKEGQSSILCLDFHHLIFDATSINIILDSLFSILNNEDDDFVDDGILRQISFEENINSDYMDEAQAFFDSMLADRDEVYELMPSVGGGDDFEHIDTLSIDNEYLTSFLQSHNITHNHFFASVFAYTLSRFAGSSKIIFNILSDGRGHIDLSQSVGMFVKTLPVLMDCTNRDVSSFLNYSSDLILSMMKYDLYPFNVLANRYDLNSNIVFQYSHNLYNDKYHQIDELKHDLQGDLSFNISNLDENNFRIKILFSQKFSKEFIEQFTESYKMILDEMINVKLLSDINYTDLSNLKLLDNYNSTENSLEYNDILDAFNNNLSKNPDAELVSYGDISYTYGEGAYIAEKVSQKLSDLGIEPQDYVSFLVPRSELYMFCVLGILSAGAVYVPLDDKHPDERLRFILKDTASKVVIVNDETYERASSLAEDTLLLNISEIINEGIGTLSELPVIYDDLASILYTSGTTGVPKGVKITRKAIINFAEFYIKKYDLSANDVFALFASISFDVSMEAIFSTVCAGACLKIIPEDIKLDMELMNKYFIDNNVTYTHLPAQVAKLFIAQNNKTSLEVLCTGGEKLGKIEINTDYRFIDSYGPTETFVDVTSIDVDKKIDDSSIGYLFDNIKAYVLDDEFRRVPIGAVGELYLSGYQIAEGYLNREEETEYAFLDNPFDDCEGYTKLYRTGDMVRFLADGSLAIAGRRDNQVKIRGNRVELSEVESVIREIDSIEDVTVQTIKNGANNELVAYIVSSDALDSLNEKVSSHIQSCRPDYMIPSFVVKLDEIPLNVNGKVDKRALPEVDISSLKIEYVAPETEAEKAIANAFEKVFNQEKIGVYDDFIRLGGDSLTAIKLISYLKDYNISAADILSLRTPKAICNSIHEFNFDLDIYSLEKGCPLNEPQLNVYLDIIAHNKKDAYIIPHNIHISKEYALDNIVDALNRVIDAHPILKMHVSDEFEVPYLVNGENPSISIKSNVEEDFIRKFITKPFDLKDSLCRFLIVENGDGYDLFAVFHHIIFDGLSGLVFEKDLFDVLDGKSLDAEDSFLKVSAFNKQIKESEEYLLADGFYESMLADIDDAGDLLESPCADGPGTYSTDLNADIKELLNSYEISENVLFTSVFAYTLSRFVGSEEVLFNIVENGRDRFNNFNAIGMYVNTLPLFVDCKNRDVASFIDDVSNSVYDVMKYNYYPFRLLASKYGIDSNIVFQFIPDWFKNDTGESDFDKYVKEDIITDMDDLINDFSVNVIQKGDDYSLSIRYSNKYSKDLIKRFSESFNIILNELINVSKLSEINYITSNDLKLLDTFNQRETPLAYDDVMDAFNDSLLKYPDNKISSSYTYAEAAFISEKIAEKLTDLGVKSQDKVAFLVERSELYLFAILSTLSIGAVYVPLDDNYPDERIKFIMEDVGASVVLVSDETYERTSNLADNQILLNISDIIKEDLESLHHLPVSYGDLACILYTSGTTGLPKGVKITRKAILNFVEFYVNESDMDNNDVYGLFASIGFDVAIKGIFSSIYTGACLKIIPNDIKLDMDKLNKFFNENNVTHTHITTQVAKLFISNSENISLTELVTGGEKLGEISNLPDCRFVDTYGPTEACVYVTSINQKDKIDSSSVGHLLNNLKAYILDDELNRVPVGAVGELYLCGYQIARGYLNRQEETDKAFIENPFTKKTGYETLYRTGDMARFLPDGSIDIVGRRDSQVKVRGNRVELSEVELVIREIDYVEDVTVQIANNDLVAYVVLTEELEDEALNDSISKYVGERKPEYMIPSFIVKLDSIPLTVNGKVDKRALPEVDINALKAEYVAPASENEKLVVEAFEKVFNQDKISVYDDFIRLGGDSLTAIKLISHLKDFNVTAADILSLRSPKAIAENIKADDFDLDIYSLESGCPLNESQLNVYLDIVANEKTDSYLIHVNTDISKEFAINNIRDALDTMLSVHPILNMCISDEFEVPYLVKGLKPSISVESDVNDEFLTDAFDLKDSLCRFLIVENDEKYELYSVFHHIIFDALSERVFIDDLNSILNGDSLELDDSFLKVSAFNSNIRDSDEYGEAKKFYDAMLVDADESGTLLDCVLSDGPGFMQSNLNLDSQSFKSFLQEYGASENVLFTSVFAYTLSRFTGSNNVLFNMIENGRDRFNNFNSIGMYVNTLPLLIDCKNQDISSFMDYIADLIYGVMKYNYYPFRVLSKEYNIDSSILFQFMPDWIGNDKDESSYGEMIEDMDDLISDLSVGIIQKGNNYWLNILHSDKYSKDMIKRFVESYKLILHEIIDADQLSDINYTLKSDVEILDNINCTESHLKYENILEAFNESLENYPNNALVSMNDVSYSYGQGAFIADKMAQKLKDMGVKQDDCVGFLVERSPLYMFCVLGILSAGAVYVPLDDNHPDERLEFILKDTDVNVLIASDETQNRAKELFSENDILNISDIVNGKIDTLNHLPVADNDSACVLYTSGTTGIPKGVEITNKAIVNYVESYVEKSDMTHEDVFALFASIGFDVGSIKSICVPIYCGASLNIVPDEVKFNMFELNNYFIRYGVTHANLTTQVAKLFINDIEDTSLKILVAGGEKLGEIDSPHDYHFIDAYGPTECCVSVTAIDERDKIDYSSIGYLLKNIKAYILDDEGRRVPVGAVGELYLSGYQVAKGYLNRKEENEYAFINNPFDSDENYEIMYRTGDMVRILPDNSLAIVGRHDSQIKVRGNRVELSEVESVIREIDYVDDVTVQSIKNNGNNELVAYVVVSNDLDGKNLREYISEFVLESKPEYMVPSFVVKLDAIPLTVNAKVDKRALPEVDLDSLRSDYVGATNETERIIMESFEEVFNQKEISLIDNFVELGGDSITAIRLISLLEKKNISCTARDILVYKTPYLIAQNVKSSENIVYEPVEGEVDLLPIQSYFFDKIAIDNYTQNFVLKANRDLELDILQKTLDELTNIHDMLRASYQFDDDNNPVQKILPVNTRICKIKEYTITEDINENLKEIFIESYHSVDLNNLLDFNLIHYGDECYLIITIHHLIVDGVSWNNLLVDLSYIYFRLKNGKEIKLSRPYPYKNWVEDVKKLARDMSDEERQYWSEVNNSLDDSAIKGQSEVFVVNVESNYDANNKLMLSEEEYLALAIARAYKKTFGEDIVFNKESHGRDETIANLSRTIGWFTTEYPVPVEVSDEYDNISLLRDVYSLKKAFGNVNHLGLNYSSLVYITNELEIKHCPVTFNFLSGEFVFKNELFKSVNHHLLSGEKLRSNKFQQESYGVSFNISRVDEYYLIGGDYASNTYIGDKFDELLENIKYELEFIANYDFDEDIVCCLSEPQLGIYLDEKVNEKGSAYLTSSSVECDNSIDEIEDAIHAVINKHPILKGRVLDTEDMPLLICDSYPSIMAVDIEDYTELKETFDLNKSLARFFIINNGNAKSIYYNVHHMISDATTCAIIDRDLNSALNGVLDDDVDLGFLQASRDSFESKFEPEYESAHEFFNRQFADIDEVNYLLDDVDGSLGKVSLPIRGIRSRVELFTKDNGITVSNLLNAVFAYSYSRFTGSEKVYYIFSENGRHEEYSQDAVGMFVRTIPILVDCKDRNVSDYLNNVSDLILESMSGSDYPFRLLASEFDLNKDVGFEYNSDLNDVSHIGDEIVFSDNADKVCEFLCVVNDLDDGYVIGVNHSDKFSQDTALRFAEVFKEVLLQFLDKENLRDIDYTSDEDIKLLDTYNQTEHDLAYEDILDAFNDNLSKYPNKDFVSMDDRHYTYGEGAYIANKISENLADLGISSQDRVGFLVPRSEYYMFAALGIMSIGGVYVPLDDNLPDERLKFILNDSDSKILIISDETYERANHLSDDIALLNISDIFKEEITSSDTLPCSYGDLACILYTSGTTGIPKGVKITRKSIVNLCEVYKDNFGINKDDVYGMFSTIGFDAALLAMITVLYSGASLSVVPQDIRLNINALNDYFINQGVTHTLITSQVGKLFMQSVEDTSLEVLLVGGEKLGEFESPDNYLLFDAFGPTEACVFVSSIKNSDKIDSSSIGFLGYNTKAYVLDNEGRRVPVGAIGELYLSGRQIAEGYLNRDEETEKAFLDNPFGSDENYDVIYRTGDIVRILPDGSLGIVGRSDEQVKIRGNRVELSEVEAVIREIDYVDDVTVQTIKNGANNELVAYVVVNTEINNLKDSICDYVAINKPDYMIPSFVIKLDEIPLNVNSKVDRRALPEVDLDSLSVEYAAPTNETERIIVEAFKKAFNREKISIYDDFARLGGDSLTAIKLLSYIKDYNISVADVLSFHTPKAISENIGEFNLDLNLYSLESGCPLNEAQLNVYLDILANKKVNSYRIYLGIEIPNEYTFEEISNALDEMINVHPILGMRVSDEYDVPYLVKGLKPSITVKKNPSEDFINEFLEEAFDLNDALSRFLIIEKDDGHSLLAVFHHLIFDGLSDGVFKKDFKAILDGENIDVDDSFLKVATFNEQIKDSDEYLEANMFYDEMLVDFDESGILLDSVSCDGPGICRDNLDLNYNSFKSFLNKNGVSENVVFTGAFAYTLSRFTGSEKVFFNINENGRDRFNNYDSIGMYVSTLPVLLDCKNQDVASFIKHVSERVYGVMKYNYYPFRLLANEYNIDSNIQFQFMPEWTSHEKRNFEKMELSYDDLIANPISDLGVELTQDGQDYRLTIVYSDKYSNDMIKRFIESYKLILHEIIEVNQLSDINYTSKSDFEILDNINRTESPLKYENILEAFNDNLSHYENNALVSMNDVTYSYGQGAFIADKIAQKLRKMGVKQGDCVGFLVERSPLYMFCVLGILSAGAVYVPLDDEHPDERLEFMLKDTATKILISSDKTYTRAEELFSNDEILNISSIVNGEIATLSYLPSVKGDLASILYTSGTTGIPKGVKITHEAIVNYADSYVEKSNMTHEDVLALFTSIGFDVGSIKSICTPLYCGASLDIVPEEIKFSMMELKDYFIRNAVTHADLTTQVAKLFISSAGDTSLKILVAGGEKLGEIDSPHDYLFIDAYGPTECCVSVSAIEESDKIHFSSIGHLLKNIKAYVLDNEFRRVPVGAVGELYLSGRQTTPGYLNRDEETEHALIDNPFSEDRNYDKLYRTGDMVRILPDGSLGIVGRQDSQIKVRGNRVELSEVESVIRQMDEVEDVTVQTVDNGGNNELVAYVVSSKESDDLRDYVREYVNEHKPDYMVPSYVVKLDEIPLNVNDKVDKRALPAVDVDSLRGEYIAPENDVEAFFAKCFEEILAVEKVGAEDNFFEMGGDSLLVIKIIMESLNNGYPINYADVFDNPTPRALSKIILSEDETLSVAEDTYDYSLIDDLIKENNYDRFIKGECSESLGNVLLTGATGFLGIHLLYELLENEDGDVYCLIRGKTDQASEEKLKSIWNYYFDRDLSEFENRIHVINGDVTSYSDFEKLDSFEIDTLINSAANVKHYAKGSEIKDINLGGTLNALKFAKTKDARFIQISTDSVSGERVRGIPLKEDKLYETNLFINQRIDNKYVESKFLAERAVLEAAINDDLDVKIMRVGNLMARSYDGQFQKNYDTNGFVNNLKSFVTIGKMPISKEKSKLGLSAIDITAKSVIALSKTPKGCCIFHPYSNHYTTYHNFVNVFNQLGLNIEFCTQESFDKSLNEIFGDESKRDGIFGLVTRLDSSDIKHEYISSDNEYTLKVLSDLGVEWPEITEKYLYDFIKGLKDLNFFKNNQE